MSGCVCTLVFPEAGLLTVFQVQEAIVVSFTATVNEGSTGLNVNVKVPAHGVATTTSLVHGLQAAVSRIYTANM